MFEDESTATKMREMRIALIKGDIPKFAETFATLVEGRKDVEDEAMRETKGFYQSIYTGAKNVFGPGSSHLGCEQVLEEGVRPDLVFISPQCAMMFEFKKNSKSVDETLEQIEEREYIKKYGEFLEMKSEQEKKWEKRWETWKSLPSWGIGINVIVDKVQKTVTKTTSIAKKFLF